MNSMNRWICHLCHYIIDNGNCTIHPTLVGYRCDHCGCPDAWQKL